VELKMAEVELAQINLEIEKTIIRAPFSGILEERMVELGDFISIGNELLVIVDNDPLVVTVRVPQRNVQFLNQGENVRVQLVNGQELNGHIRYIASRGDEASRTFRVEIEILNTTGLRAGSSATAYIPKGEIEAHFISGALLSLNDEGVMGVKTVDNNGLVSFHPVTIELSEVGGMWVSGLPETAMVIVSGQGFAKTGERVRVIDVSNDSAGLSLSNLQDR